MEPETNFTEELVVVLQDLEGTYFELFMEVEQFKNCVDYKHPFNPLEVFKEGSILRATKVKIDHLVCPM